MPVDTIDQLEQDIVNIDTGRIASQEQGRRTLGQDLNSSMQGALRGAQTLQADEINVQKSKEVDDLLKSGVEGIAAYAKELGIQDDTVFRQMATNAKDPKDLIPIYSLIKKQAEKTISSARDSEISGTIVKSIEELNGNPNATFEDYSILISKLDALKEKASPEKAKLIQDTQDNLFKSGKERFKSEEKKLKGNFGDLYDENGQKLPTIQQDRTKIEKIQRAITFGSRGGQRVLGTSINKQVAIQDALDTIKGIDAREFKATLQIGSELASIIAQVMASGQGTTESDRKAFFPASWSGTVKDAWQTATGKPIDAMPKDLLDQLKHMLTREKKFWDQRIQDIGASLAGTLAPIFNTVAVNPNTGKRTKTRKDAQRLFINWLLTQNDATKTISERIGEGSTYDILNLMTTKEERKLFEEDAQNADMKYNPSNGEGSNTVINVGQGTVDNKQDSQSKPTDTVESTGGSVADIEASIAADEAELAALEARGN